MPLHTVKNYLSLIKFSHTIFALPFAIIGYFLGINHSSKPFDYLLLLKVFACMVFARNAAMAFNRYADKEIDKNNPRTFAREIPMGILSEKAVLFFVIVNAILFIVTTYFINNICFYLSPIALLIILGYSLSKRFTALCHLILGLGLALAPIGAYLAVTSKFNLTPILFSITVLFWVSGFDIIYALQDEDFDKQNQLNSIPAKIGKANALSLSKTLHAISSLIIIYIGIYGKFHYPYWIGVLLFIGLIINQHRIVKPNDLSRVNLAFFTSNGIASLAFGILVIYDILFL